LDDLQDRFGKPPKPVFALIDTIRLRRIAQELGFEKLVLKNDLFIAWLVFNQESAYYSGPVFSGIINFLQQHPTFARMKENKGKLSLNFGTTTTVKTALHKLQQLHQSITPNS
jgi:transcription-repair coupling factor (superfamily II helicase)